MKAENSLPFHTTSQTGTVPASQWKLIIHHHYMYCDNGRLTKLTSTRSLPPRVKEIKQCLHGHREDCCGAVVQCLTYDRRSLVQDSPEALSGAQWLSSRVLDSRPRSRGFEPHQRHCVVSLSKNINPSLVLVQPRKTRPFITERF